MKGVHASLDQRLLSGASCRRCERGGRIYNKSRTGSCVLLGEWKMNKGTTPTKAIFSSPSPVVFRTSGVRESSPTRSHRGSPVKEQYAPSQVYRDDPKDDEALLDGMYTVRQTLSLLNVFHSAQSIDDDRQLAALCA